MLKDDNAALCLHFGVITPSFLIVIGCFYIDAFSIQE